MNYIVLDFKATDSWQYSVKLCLQNSFILFRVQNHVIFKETTFEYS